MWGYCYLLAVMSRFIHKSVNFLRIHSSSPPPCLMHAWFFEKTQLQMGFCYLTGSSIHPPHPRKTFPFITHEIFTTGSSLSVVSHPALLVYLANDWLPHQWNVHQLSCYQALLSRRTEPPPPGLSELRRCMAVWEGISSWRFTSPWLLSSLNTDPRFKLITSQ